jgi:hypothetical protein
MKPSENVLCRCQNVNVLLSYVGEVYFMTHPVFHLFYFFSLLHAWVSIVSINLCNPCDQGRVDITIENMYFRAGNNLNIFRSLSCIQFYMFAKIRANQISVGFWICMFVLSFLTAWYIKPVDYGFVDMGRRK